MASYSLRHFIPDVDAPMLAQWVLDPEQSNFFRGQLVPPTLEELYSYPKWSGVWPYMVIREEDGKSEVIGMMTLSNFDLRSRSAHYSAIATKEHQGKGYARETVKMILDYCFKVLGMRKMVTVVVEERLKDMYESMGFRFEGVQYQETYLDGKYQDNYRLSVFPGDLKE